MRTQRTKKREARSAGPAKPTDVDQFIARHREDIDLELGFEEAWEDHDYDEEPPTGPCYVFGCSNIVWWSGGEDICGDCELRYGYSEADEHDRADQAREDKWSLQLDNWEYWDYEPVSHDWDLPQEPYVPMVQPLTKADKRIHNLVNRTRRLVEGG